MNIHLKLPHYFSRLSLTLAPIHNSTYIIPFAIGINFDQATDRPHALLEGAGAVGPRPLLGAIDITVLIMEGLAAAMEVHLHR